MQIFRELTEGVEWKLPHQHTRYFKKRFITARGNAICPWMNLTFLNTQTECCSSPRPPHTGTGRPVELSGWDPELR